MAVDAGASGQANVARAGADLQKSFADIALPSIRTIAGNLLSDLGSPGTEPASVKAAFDDQRTNLKGDYETAGKVGQATLDTQIKQAGGFYNPGAASESTTALTSSLTKARASSLRALAFQEAQTGQDVAGQEISLLTGLGNSTMQGALGQGANAAGANQLLSQLWATKRKQNSTIGSEVGTILGGIVGGFAGNPVIGAGLGGAVGGMVGGAF